MCAPHANVRHHANIELTKEKPEHFSTNFFQQLDMVTWKLICYICKEVKTNYKSDKKMRSISVQHWGPPLVLILERKENQCELEHYQKKKIENKPKCRQS